MDGKLTRELQQIFAAFKQRVYRGKERRNVSLSQSHRGIVNKRAGRLTQNVANRLLRNDAAAINGELLKRREGVTHATARMTNNKINSCVFVGKALIFADVDQVLCHLVSGNGAEVKALHARQNGCKNFLRIGGTHDKRHVRRGLLQRLEQGIKCRRGKHVHLVDDVDLALTAHRSVTSARNNLFSHVINAGVRSGVNLKDVWMLTSSNQLAVLASAVGQMTRRLVTEDSFCQQASHGGLTCAARSTEQVCVTKLLLQNRSLKGADHMFLANYLLKRLRAILCIQ